MFNQHIEVILVTFLYFFFYQGIVILHGRSLDVNLLVHMGSYLEKARMECNVYLEEMVSRSISKGLMVVAKARGSPLGRIVVY